MDRFAEVYDRHRAQVYAQCLRRLRSAPDADDATQVTFLRAWAAIQRGSGPRRTGPWLATIARNVCADRLGDPRQAVPVDTTELVLVDDGPAPDAGLISEADGAEVRAALEHLPFAQRSALHLREVEELPYATIGERLGMPVSAIETLLFRARGNLRDELRAVRTPMGCEQARSVAGDVRSGASVTADQRKRLRNHRAECARCAWLPVRRARGLAGARAAAVLAILGAAGALRRAFVTPLAEAAAAASAPAKTVAVVITASTAAAGGVAVEHRPAHREPGDRPVASAPRAGSSAANTARPRGATSAPAVRSTRPASAPLAARSTPPVAARSTHPVASVHVRRENGSSGGEGGGEPSDWQPRVHRVDHSSSSLPRHEGGATPDGGGPSDGGLHRGEPQQGDGDPRFVQSGATGQGSAGEPARVEAAQMAPSSGTSGEGERTRSGRQADGPGARSTTTG